MIRFVVVGRRSPLSRIGMLGVLTFQQAFFGNRLAFPHMAARGRCKRNAICAAVLIGHRVTSSRIFLVGPAGHGGPLYRWRCHVCRCL